MLSGGHSAFLRSWCSISPLQFSHATADSFSALRNSPYGLWS